MKSLSEIETTTIRASKAAGYSWGIAEEVGKGVRLLELYGLPGIKNLNAYYKLKPNKKFENLNFINKNNESNLNSYCPIALGISILDQIKILDKSENIKFNKIAYPLLLLPFLSRSSEIIGKKIHFKFDQYEFLLNLNVNILSNFFTQDPSVIASKVEINFLDNKDNFSENDWKSLYKLSEETFVEETDSLKQGAAGAGLTDND
jgi:hypothetical protein